MGALSARAALVVIVALLAGCGGEAVVPLPEQGEKTTARITGYTYYDNTPHGSAKIDHSVIHQVAGGVGTVTDPITVAVGHSMATGQQVLDFPAGTRFYLPYLKRYFIVEDSCGDGPTPEKGPCHLNAHGPEPWLDIWLNGQGLGAARAHACAGSVTGNHEVIRSPGPDLPVEAGLICD